jgi:spore germination cell wall hydrolase CwlJ-like protein
MSRKVKLAAAMSVAATMVFTISGAFAQDPLQGAECAENVALAAPEGAGGANPIQFITQAIVQPLPEDGGQREQDFRQYEAASLGELVAEIPVSGTMSKDMRCLASAIYFEARGEPLQGQLAVGRVIVNRAASNRFPTSYCGVVYQRSQFSFVRRGSMPPIKTNSRAWRNAQAIAKIADESLWDSPAKGALFFHAASVQPGWRLTRLGRVSSHIFYR